MYTKAIVLLGVLLVVVANEVEPQEPHFKDGLHNEK